MPLRDPASPSVYSDAPHSAAPMSSPTVPLTGQLVPANTYLPQAPEQVLMWIADIGVTRNTVQTRAGTFALRGSRWQVMDRWLSEQKTPGWAITLAIVGFCLVGPLSLLFLLAKTNNFHGMVEITVTSGPYHYVAHVPVTDQQQVLTVHQQVNYARSLATL
jgi:hypothetical protein